MHWAIQGTLTFDSWFLCSTSIRARPSWAPSSLTGCIRQTLVTKRSGGITDDGLRSGSILHSPNHSKRVANGQVGRAAHTVSLCEPDKCSLACIGLQLVPCDRQKQRPHPWHSCFLHSNYGALGRPVWWVAAEEQLKPVESIAACPPATHAHSKSPQSP